MKGDSLRAIFPEVVRPLLPDLFDHEAPFEEKATCETCAMCPPAGAPPSEAVTYFRPDAKCCTFQPVLPNYLVGAILADERADMAEGKRRIQERIALRIGVSPQWIAPSRKVDLLLRASRRSAFGRSLALLCPFFERTQKNCTIWRHREAVCTTFHCKYVAGADGEIFWRRVRWYMNRVEEALSAQAAQSLIPGHHEPKPLEGSLTLEELEDRGPPEATYAALWKAWAGREEDFYVKCFEHVRSLGREGMEPIASRPEMVERLRDVEEAREKLVRPTLPERLAPNPEMTSAETSDGVLVSTYSTYEPLMLTRELFELVHMFGPDRTVAEVRAEVLREHDVEVPEALLVALCQFRVLVPSISDAGRGCAMP
jgi:Fe-S-cluster containining protein